VAKPSAFRLFFAGTLVGGALSGFVMLLLDPPLWSVTLVL
jgi:hypothetical protein